MGLFQKAVETYDAMQSLVGKKQANRDEVLAPIGYVVRPAGIEITVDADGNFVRATKIDEKIPIPCTEKSSGRSSGLAPHPLCDNLGYVTEKDAEKHALYLSGIKSWIDSGYGNSKLDAIYTYLVKGCVLRDCKESEVLQYHKDGNLSNENSIVTWRVVGLGEDSGAVHEDLQLMKNYSEYYINRNQAPKGLCMVSGTCDSIVSKHPGVIGQARIVSSNDKENFTYLGRFSVAKGMPKGYEAYEALTIGYISSQKAHNILRWLLSDDSTCITVGNRKILCWNPQGKIIKSPTLPLIPQTNSKIIPSDYGRVLRDAINGYKSNFSEQDSVVIAAFEDINSGKGRLSVTYYNELEYSDFLDRLYYWDNTCCWYDNRWGVQSPPLSQIVKYAFGTEKSGEIKCDTRVWGQQVQRLISCRLDKARFPMDIMRNLVIKASNLQIYKGNNADNILFVTCAVIKKFRHDYLKEEWEMALDENKMDRSYQFGRLLAVLERIEIVACRGDKKRDTNAIRTQAFFSKRPLTAFTQIMTSLKTGYYPRLSVGARTYYEKLIGEIMEKISLSGEDALDKPLTETYLMGYYLQKNAFALYTKRETESVEEE